VKNANKDKKMVRRGRRNRQRGAELQRHAVNLAKEFGLDAINRDRGGAQHEKGDVEIEGVFYGCKRRKNVPAWVLPEKQEEGVVFRGERQSSYISVPYEKYLFLLKAYKWLRSNHMDGIL
tara:strand:+ start:21697 stop:22056 length:360 start_codon:yes stop_codon:yes gene_type:complete